MAADETRLEADRRKALSLAISQIEKQLGKGSIMRMGADSARVKSRGHPHRRHQPRCRHRRRRRSPGPDHRDLRARVLGQDHAHASTSSANVQRMGGVAAYVDAEHALDIDYAKKLGVNVEELLVSQPDTGEQALEIVRDPGPLRRGGSSSSSTRSRPWCPRPKSKARWATATWACRPGS